MLRYYARNIKGSDNYWRAKTQELESWIQHHISRGRGPPTFFITLSCAENWWPDLRRNLAQLERHAKNDVAAQHIENNDFRAMQKAAKRYPLFVNDFFMKRARKFMKEILKDVLGIEHYWGRVEFAPGRGQIHLHMLGIAKNRAYLNYFYRAKTLEDKAHCVLHWHPWELPQLIAGLLVSETEALCLFLHQKQHTAPHQAQTASEERKASS